MSKPVSRRARARSGRLEPGPFWPTTARVSSSGRLGPAWERRRGRKLHRRDRRMQRKRAMVRLPCRLTHHQSSLLIARQPRQPRNVTSNSGPANTGAGFSSTAPNEIGQPSVVTADNAGHGNSQHASEPSIEAGSKPGNGVGNGGEHHDKASEGPGEPAKKADPGGAEHGKSGHSPAANGPDAAEIDPGAAAAASAGHRNAQHASKPESAKAASTDSTEAGSKPGHGVGNGGEHHASASDAAQGPAKAAEPGGTEHGKSGHSAAASPPDGAEIDTGATAANAGHGNAQHASKPGSAKAASTELTEAGVQTGPRRRQWRRTSRFGF